MRLPLPDNVIEQTVGSTVDYKTMWRNKTGSASCLQEPSSKSTMSENERCFLVKLVGFFVQTPADDWGFYSFAVSTTRHDDNTRRFKSVLICSKPDILEICHSLGHIPYNWKMTDLPMVVLPLALLRHQVQQTSQRLASLIQQVEEVESTVADGSQITDFDV